MYYDTGPTQNLWKPIRIYHDQWDSMTISYIERKQMKVDEPQKYNDNRSKCLYISEHQDQFD